MTNPTPAEGAATPAMRRKADLMVGLFVGAAVALLGGIVLLVTGSAGLGIGLVVVGVLAGGAGVAVLRSISPEERERLVPPGAEADDGA